MSGSCTVGLCGPDPGRMDYCSQVGFPQFTLLIIWSNTGNSSGGLSHQEMGHIFSPKLLSRLVCSFCIDILTPAWCAFMNVPYIWNMSSLYAYNINGIGGISAVLYYTSCWDFVGIKIEIVGMDPNCYHPKPWPTTPHDFVDSALFLYQKET